MEGRDWLEIAAVFALMAGLLYVVRLLLPGVPSFVMVLPIAMLYVWLRDLRK